MAAKAPAFWQTRLSPAALALLPLSLLFGLVAGGRRRLYRAGVLRSVRLPVPVIVVGNVAAGGSGKTPVVDWLVAQLRAAGHRPGIVSRGYGSTLGDGVALVPAGERWPDGSLRPALEDLWGAGSVLAALDLDGVRMSPEARHAAASYALVAGDLHDALHDCASGRELVAVGYGDDVDAAADLDADDTVPVLTAEGFVAG